MIQVQPVSPVKNQPVHLLENQQVAHQQAAHLQESRTCLPKGLQELHLRAVRRHAALLAIGQRTSAALEADEDCPCDTTDASDASDLSLVSEVPKNCTCSLLKKTGINAPINPAGFTQVTKLCCPSEMEIFFNRLLDVNDYIVCSKPHVQGLMHWFTCVPDM